MNYSFYENKRASFDNPDNLSTDFDEVINYHQAMSQYQVTPLYSWTDFAKYYQIKAMYIKDEAYRFNLNAFKGLGVSYALRNLKEKNPVLVACTDGNHGKALAWMGMINHYQVIIFMPEGSEVRRVKAIEKYGAKVYVTKMNYDDTVRYADDFAKKHHYHLIQDTIIGDNTKIVKDIMLGYTTLINEAVSQMKEKPTHVFIQAGVGSLAGGIIWYLANQNFDIPYIGVIEADCCPCIYESIKNNQNCSIKGNPQTIMAGLNCGEANSIALKLIGAYATWLIKCQDQITIQGMNRAKNPIGNDQKFSAGESGAVGLGLAERILKENREIFKIDHNSVILVINSEGELQDEK